ncbi:hypothetical protein PCANB_000094 [Pneumocystis canis]|nr:hypothetical protein PCANB_000094 [Pneumocystis canis]
MDQKIKEYFFLDSEKYSKELVNIISRDINNKNLKILEFIEFLEKYLTIDENFIRGKGQFIQSYYTFSNSSFLAITLLSDVIKSISTETLHSKQLHIITSFYCNCLDNQLFIKEILMGLYFLQKMDFFDDTSAIFLSTELFEKINPKSNPQPIRYIVFKILHELIIKHQKALKKMGSKFIEDLIKIVDEEKDPRNLILVFSIMHKVIFEFDITSHAKDIFNQLFCYFPITFKSSSNDVFEISADDLKLWLKKCISANDALSQYSIPSLIDKYDFSSVDTKKDIIDTLSFCIETYSPHIIENYVTHIWNVLKNEIFENLNEDLVKKSLNCLFMITKIFSQGIIEISENISLIKFLKPISDEINKHFEEPDTMIAKNSIKILYSLSSASKYSFEILSKFCISNLLSKFEKENSINAKAAILEFISFILLAGSHVYDPSKKETNKEIPNDSILIKERNKIFIILCNSLTNLSFSNKYIKATAIHALLTLTEIHNLLQYDELELIIQHFSEIIINEENNLKAEALEALIRIAETNTKLILEITFPKFLKLLSETNSIVTLDNFSQPLNEIILTALSHLCIKKQLFDTLITYLLNEFDNIVSVDDKNILHGRTLIFTLLLVIRTNFIKERMDIDSYFNQLLPELFTRIINASTCSSESIIMDFKIINIISQITNLIVRSLDLERQKIFFEDLVNLFMNGNSNLLFFSKNNEILKIFKPFEKKSDLYQKRTLPIFVSAFAGIQRELLPLNLESTFIKIATDLILESNLEDQQQIFLFRFISLIYNKFDNKIDFNFCKNLLDEISKNSQYNLEKKKIIILYTFWVIKALILKTNNYGYTLLDNLMNYMNDKHLGEFISHNFGIVLSEDEFINKENFVSIRLLYKQKFFYFILPKLIKMLDSTTPGNYLIILSNIIQNTPKQIILSELTSIFPLFLQCFSLEDNKLKVLNIDTLYIITLESPDLITEHLVSIISFLLAFITDKYNNHMDVQIAALKCLGLFPTILRPESIQPFKSTVVRKLVEVLDNPRRDVRVEACKTKYKWHM